MEDIKVYLKKRKPLPNHSETSYLFLNPSGKRLSTNTPRFHLKKIIKLLGWEKSKSTITLHSFRRSFATICNDNYTDLVSIQRSLGHSDIKTT